LQGTSDSHLWQRSGVSQFEASWGNSSQKPISKKPITKMGWWSGSRYRSGVQTPVLKKQNKQKKPFPLLIIFSLLPITLSYTSFNFLEYVWEVGYRIFHHFHATQ
jgi:hypothetical protein